MSIIVGSPSGKFVMMAAMLLFHARVDGDPVSAAIVPGAAKSALSTRLAHQVHRHGGAELPVKIGVRGTYFYAPVAHENDDPHPQADFVLGQDLLADHPIELDFRRHELTGLLAGDYRARMRRYHAIMLTRDGPSRWHVALTLEGGPEVNALLDLTSPDAITLGRDEVGSSNAPTGPVTIGGVRLPIGVTQQAGAGPSTVGLGIFSGRRVIFDLAHDRIWIDA